MITRKKSERTIALAQFALVETKRYLTAGGKLSKRSPEEAKKIFSSIDPDKMSPTDGLALVKELASSSSSTRSIELGEDVNKRRIICQQQIIHFSRRFLERNQN